MNLTVKNIVLWITSIAAISGAVSWYGSTQWVEQKTASATHRQLRVDLTKAEQDIAVVKESVKNIDKRTERMAETQWKIWLKVNE